MKICLKTLSRQNNPETVAIKLQERLPEHIVGPCDLSCTFQVEHYDSYFLLTLHVNGILTVICQRCLQSFQYNYENESKVAICVNDATAEMLMEQFECIVASDSQVDLMDILTDELYLFTTEKHPNIADCDAKISQLISNEDDLCTQHLD